MVVCEKFIVKLNKPLPLDATGEQVPASKVEIQKVHKDHMRLCMPPATTSVSPVTYAASSEAR